MSRFIDELYRYLKSDRPSATGFDVSKLTDRWASEKLVALLRRFESAEAVEHKVHEPGGRVWHLFREWGQPTVVGAFCRRLGALALDYGLGGSGPLESVVAVGLARELGLPDSLASLAETLALDSARDEVNDARASFEVADYARETRLLVEREGRLELSAPGRVFLQLTGKEQVRWLLHLETLQSTGPDDRWRVSRDSAAWLVTSLPSTVWYDDAWDLPVRPETVRRLTALHLVDRVEHESGGGAEYRLAGMGREIFGDVSSDEGSPLRLMAETLLADLTLSVSPTGSEAHHRSAAEAVSRQTRLVAHEINNALVPVKAALSQLYKEMRLRPASELSPRLQERIDQGLERTFRFVRELSAAARLGGPNRETFEPSAAVADAVAAVTEESGFDVEKVIVALPPVLGDRSAFVRALVNVIRNATQAVERVQTPRVRVSGVVVSEGRALEILIEDNGPGVPEARRSAIFSDGVSGRPGGQGMGLGLAREIVREMSGSLDYQTSSLGGAGFVVRLPASGA